MGYELRRWLADHLPDVLSASQRLVALEIADQANDRTRRAYGRDMLAVVVRRTGLSDAKQLGKALGKLAVNGVELRVPVRDRQGNKVTDARGRVLYACNGHAMEFRIPTLAECPALKMPQLGDLEDAPTGGPSELEAPPVGPEAPPTGGASSGEGPPTGGPISSSPPQNSSTPPRAAIRIVTGIGATEEEAREIIETIQAKGMVKSSLPGLLRSMADGGDLAAELAALRKRAHASDLRAWLDGLKTLPECPHGLPGGDQRRPDTGTAQCPQCRGHSNGRRPEAGASRGGLEAWT